MLAALALLAVSSCGSSAATATQPNTAAEASRVLVVINQSEPVSLSIGSYYIKKRQIPRQNVVMVDTTTQDNISQDAFDNALLKPIRANLEANKNKIDFIVLIKGVPIRLRDDGGYSVDGAIAAMDIAGPPLANIAGIKDEKEQETEIRRCVNPYFNKNDSFSHAKYKIYLVTRLDGYTVADAKQLVDNSVAAKAEKGPFFFDSAGNRKSGGYGEMDATLRRADEVLKTKGYDSKCDDTAEFIAPTTPLEGYASWGSNDGAFNADRYKAIRFKPGALCETFVSTSGRTFNPTTGGQSLIADLIANGVTGVKGYVSEPYTIALAKPDILFDRYTSGFNLAESFYMASPLIKWKDVIVGDPLCNPFRK